MIKGDGKGKNPYVILCFGFPSSVVSRHYNIYFPVFTTKLQFIGHVFCSNHLRNLNYLLETAKTDRDNILGTAKTDRDNILETAKTD